MAKPALKWSLSPGSRHAQAWFAWGDPRRGSAWAPHANPALSPREDLVSSAFAIAARAVTDAPCAKLASWHKGITLDSLGSAGGPRLRLALSLPRFESPHPVSVLCGPEACRR